MTVDETLKVMAVLRTAYPGYYRNKSREDIEAAVNLWCEMFPEPYRIIDAAIKALICMDESGYPPTIGQVKSKIRLLTSSEKESELTAWAKVRKAIQRSTYHSEREFYSLPDEIQSAIGNPEALKEWAALAPDKVETVIQSNFLRSYRYCLAQKSELEAIPATVRKIISGSTSAGIEQSEFPRE